MLKFNTLKKALVASTMLAGAIVAPQVTADTLMIENPAISKKHIAFTYAGDLWIADRKGNNPRQITTHLANESAPHFSPDGKWIAFTSDRDGNADVYVVSTSGGAPKRLTWHPGADVVQDWSPDGKRILFTSRREMTSGRSAQAWEVSVDGGLPTKVMDAVVMAASWASDGETLAYQPYNVAHRGSSGWRNHRGGSTPPIWIMKPNGDSYTEVPHVRAGDTNPVWAGGDVYFLSDRTGVRNIHKYDTGSGTVSQVSKEDTWDILDLDVHGDTLIYNAGGQLKTVSTKGKTSSISVDINPDLVETRVRWVNAMRGLEGASLSPTGKRALVSARGEIFTVPLKDGSTRNITGTSGARERDALWSPKGGEIAYTSDESGKQVLIIASQDGEGETRSLDLGDDSNDYYLEMWGGEGSHIIYRDHMLNIWAIDVESGERTKIDTDNYRNGANYSMTKDGRYMAYTKVTPAGMVDIYIHDFETGEKARVTDGMGYTGDVAFSHDGKHLFFTLSTNAGPSRSLGLDMSTQERPLRMGVYAAVLNADGKSPLLPKSDEEKVKEDKSDEAEKEDKAEKSEDDKAEKKDADKKKKKSGIDFDGLSDRIIALPVAEKSYYNLAAAADGSLYYLDAVQPGTAIGTNGRAERGASLVRFDFKSKKASKAMDGVQGFDLSHDGKTLLAMTTRGQLHTGKAGAKVKTKPLNTSDVKIRLNPREEWEQIFDETVRLERQYFYDPNSHGLDWDAVSARYKKLLPHVGRRADLNRLLVEMIAELQVGHNRTGGGDVHREQTVPVGLLGANLRNVDGRTVVDTIFDGENWNPFLDAPLAAPGIGVKEGDTIHAVNGVELDAKTNIFSLLENAVGKQVRLLVSSDGNADNAKTVTVVPTRNTAQIRHWAWVEGNRKKVDELSNGRLGYVYMPNTAGGGYTYFNRMFFPQIDKEGMLLDERQNGGGQAANYITDVLARQYLASWKDRAGLIYDTPGGAMYGPKVMLIDQDAGSGGDFLPYSFKRMGLGKLIGKTTWGGLIGIAANRGLIDGGFIVVPNFRFFNPDGEWAIENEGTAPDIDVTLDPVAVNRGEDTQLKRGVEELLKELETYKPIKQRTAPAYPTKLGG